jgi:glycosyltransferase involved in cell wall biosynthesis
MADSSRPRRVLHVSMPTAAGVPAVLVSYIQKQVAAGWVVYVACPATGRLPGAAADLGARVLRWQAVREPGPTVAAETLQVQRIVAATRPDVVHLHSAKAGLAGRLAIRRRYPTVFQPHAWSFQAASGVTSIAARHWEQLAIRWTDALVCVSAAERRVGTVNGIAGAPTWVIPNNVDYTKFEATRLAGRAQARARLGLPDRALAVCVGRLCEQKGQADLLDAWARVPAAVDGAMLVLVGDGPDRARLESRVAGRPDVLLVGERDDVPWWMAAADVVVVPSRWEGMALVPLEAMASARSVIATDVPGMAECLPVDAGTVVRTGDRWALSAELTLRLSHRALADAEGVAGLRYIKEEQDHAAGAAAAVLRVYELLVGRTTVLDQQPDRSLRQKVGTYVR